MRIVTSGVRFLDIDAFAGCIAYAELLGLQGETAYAISTAPWNESISPIVRSWGGTLLSQYKPDAKDTFTLIDISEPAWFDQFVEPTRVDEVIDHHPGFEAYWRERIGDRAHIELIGAACTLVYERWVKAGQLNRLTTATARLLATAIVENTLNFGAHVTTERDRQAYAALMKTAELPETWPAQYFADAQTAMLADVPSSLAADTKIVTFKGFVPELAVGQLAVWDGTLVLEQQLSTIRQTLAQIRPQWFMNLISIGDGASYIVAEDPAVQAWLANLLGLKFENGLARAGRLWLRKEIIKQSLT